MADTELVAQNIVDRALEISDAEARRAYFDQACGDDADLWPTFNTQSMLGEALLGQKKYLQAEPLLLSGYQGMKQREKSIPLQAKLRLTEALVRLVELHEATGNKDEADKWRKEKSEAIVPAPKKTHP